MMSVAAPSEQLQVTEVGAPALAKPVERLAPAPAPAEESPARWSVIASSSVLGGISVPQPPADTKVPQPGRGSAVLGGVRSTVLTAVPLRGKAAYFVTGGGVALVVAGLAAWFLFFSAEARLVRLLDKGSVVLPEGQSAYDLYQQLKAGGIDSGTKQKVRGKALPLIVAAGDALLQKRVEAASFSDSELKSLGKLYEWGADLAPEDARMLARHAYAQGLQALIDKRPNDALRHFQRSTELDSSWAPAWNDLGRSYVRLNDHVHAEEGYRKALQADPGWVFPQLNLAGVYLHRQAWPEAEQAYLRATQMDTALATPWYFLGQVYEVQRRLPEAVNAYERAVELAATKPSSAFRVDKVQERIAKLKERIATTPPPPMPTSWTITVAAVQPWTGARIYVNRGDRLTFSATGSVHACVQGTCDSRYNRWVGPEGLIGLPNLNGFPNMGLIARIGESAPFYIGRGVSLAASAEGWLVLGVNDAPNFADNGGNLVVTVTLVR
jgi:tetratricopeptide (TPR) repeat protein